MLERALIEWGGRCDLWVFGYGSLIWRPDFDFVERRAAKVHGWHRALKMWSRLNRGTPECPGLVFGMLPGGSCRGMAFRVQQTHARQVMVNLWQREMVLGVYDPRWLDCQTSDGMVRALAFTLPRSSPSYTGILADDEYRRYVPSLLARQAKSDTVIAGLPEMIRLAEHSEDVVFRRGAVQAVGAAGEVAHLPWLMREAQADDDLTVRIEAVKALAQYAKRPEVLDCLARIAGEEKHERLADLARRVAQGEAL